jgi:hypothetical protein
VYINATASSKKKSHEDDNSVIEEIVEKLRDSNIKSYSHSKYGCKEGSYGKEHYAREAEDELWCIMQDNDKQPLKGSTVDRGMTTTLTRHRYLIIVSECGSKKPGVPHFRPSGLATRALEVLDDPLRGVQRRNVSYLPY